MPFEEVKYNFPHEAKESEDSVEIELEPSSAETIDLKQSKAKPEAAEEAAEENAYEIVDDTPPEDRGRKPSTPPEEVTDDELENYSEKVANRIKHFSKGYHDERRAKEEAQRERQELERYARKLVEENQNLKTSVTKSRAAIVQQVQRMLTQEIDVAKRNYAAAYESGNTEQLMEAEEALSKARLRQSKVDAIKPSLQKEDNVVESKQSSEPAQQPARDPRADQWASENTWFGQDDEMTSFALGLHQKLLKQGVDPKSEAYYESINSRMREVFPGNFGEQREEPKKKSSNVAPATRSRAPSKVTLTKSQVAIAKKLGVPLDIYARQVADEMRKSNNG